MENKTIGVIGVGVVGNAVKTYFEQEGFEVFTYDKFIERADGKVNDFDITCKADYIFLCLPTPHLKVMGYDLSAYFETLPKIPDGKIVIVKSTVLPGTVDKFQKEYPNLFFLFNPEFLTAKNAVEEFKNPEVQIVGYTAKSLAYAPDVMEILPDAQKNMLMTTKEAEMVKLMRNSFFVTKIVFANMIYDICRELDIDYSRVLEAFLVDKRIGKSHLEILHEGGRGGGGMCFPKDISAFNDLISTKDRVWLCNDVWQFFGMVESINKRLLELSGKK